MKNRILKSRLSRAGFIRLPRRGKGSHSIWKHPHYPLCFIQSGKDNRDAKPYQLKQLKKINMVIAQGSETSACLTIKLVLKQINHHE